MGKGRCGMEELDVLVGGGGQRWAHHILLATGDGREDVLVRPDPLFDALATRPVVV